MIVPGRLHRFRRCPPVWMRMYCYPGMWPVLCKLHDCEWVIPLFLARPRSADMNFGGTWWVMLTHRGMGTVQETLAVDYWSPV